MKAKRVFYLLFFITGILLLSSCNINYGRDYYNVKWTSSDPIIEFYANESKDDDLEKRGLMIGYLINNAGEKVDVGFVWEIGNTLYALKLDEIKYDENYDYDNALFECQIENFFGNFYLTFRRDNIFDNKYNKIQLVKTSIE